MISLSGFIVEPIVCRRYAICSSAIFLVFILLWLQSLSRFVHHVPVEPLQAPISVSEADDYDFEEIRYYLTQVTLAGVLRQASMPNNTVILSMVNKTYAAESSVFDIFRDSFEDGEDTNDLSSNLIIMSLDVATLHRCLHTHANCYAPEVEFSDDPYFRGLADAEMPWLRIRVLSRILEMGYSFLYMDADTVVLRDPFPHLDLSSELQMAPEGGLLFVTSSNRTIDFFKLWYGSRLRYPQAHDLNTIIVIHSLGLEIRRLDVEYFAGFCTPIRNLILVCTIRADCCHDLGSKVADLRLVVKEWKIFKALPGRVKWATAVSFPKKCRP